MVPPRLVVGPSVPWGINGRATPAGKKLKFSTGWHHRLKSKKKHKCRNLYARGNFSDTTVDFEDKFFFTSPNITDAGKGPHHIILGEKKSKRTTSRPTARSRTQHKHRARRGDPLKDRRLSELCARVGCRRALLAVKPLACLLCTALQLGGLV